MLYAPPSRSAILLTSCRFGVDKKTTENQQKNIIKQI